MPILKAGSKSEIGFHLNGRAVIGSAEPRMLLSDFLRHEIGAYGTHVGCEHGVCGACTVQIDGQPQRACLTLAVQVEGRSVETVEGLAGPEGRLSVLQEAFRANFAVQCGYCTAGILMSVEAFLRDCPEPTEEQIRDLLSGHLCRCTGYTNIVCAVKAAAAAAAAEKT
ncbi:MAG: (2Fe-2S)-binding protein [Tistlia sp.]|uniref:(2Fe-2S)-binding protein n=1 Tax=Tistlia sp. TaxID=3057121 RepID=UPI0034A252B0